MFQTGFGFYFYFYVTLYYKITHKIRTIKCFALTLKINKLNLIDSNVAHSQPSQGLFRKD